MDFTDKLTIKIRLKPELSGRLYRIFMEILPIFGIFFFGSRYISILMKDGSENMIYFYDDGKTQSEYVKHDAYAVAKQWSESNNLTYLENEYVFENNIRSHYIMQFDHDNGNPSFEYLSHKDNVYAREYYADGKLKHEGCINESYKFDGYGKSYEYTNDQQTVHDGIFENGVFQKVQSKLFPEKK
eukprot:535279_1